MGLDWQSVLVIAIEIAAVLYLVRKLILPARTTRGKPDVAASSLVRKKR